jgi:hypothetical protein
MFENRKYMIIKVEDLPIIQFDTVLETSIDTVRLSVDGTKTFVKWDGEIIPSCVASITECWGPYTHDEMLQIMGTEEWTEQIEEEQN